ncbi:hypothetical protein EYF80_005481 [Liparis tanakae]|uniref:Uncharacterized protein n=1 Tax=Liparis tanakae TaxID=230148 RepID=A0A4Z2J2T0_9TELE|nr:hypothetical protein EYF80_005481 [Liparis tanakae]
MVCQWKTKRVWQDEIPGKESLSNASKFIWGPVRCSYSVTIMQRPHRIDHDYQAKLLMTGPSEKCTAANLPPRGPPQPSEDNQFLSPAALPASHH